ncbi:MAG: DNA polymerase III subunit gamma/tau [Lachnospiraceae bacterium]|nr:DNA polymerase III subunit gamma/tau [Lachnospiraceae bacterium]
MSYTALYRKWRPKTFNNVKGQEPVIRTLKNQIASGRIGHAYLFCGSRGTGKTSVAKIFAKAVNCEHPEGGEPCCECDTCRAIESGASMNILEIDAASNNGVDFIRQIEEEIQYPPTEGRYRVYIVDEVHMLTGPAFNAFLKTLEEPPAYVIFILATTEPHKIPATILSRCQQYDFRRISVDTICDRLRELCEGESIDADDRAIGYIARKAEGGLRDAISLLDRAWISAGGETLTYDLALKSLGAVESDVFSKYLRCIVNRDIRGMLSLIDEVIMSGREISQFSRDFAWYLRNVLLTKAAPEEKDLVDIMDEDRERLIEEARTVGEDELIRLIRIYSACYNEMRAAINKRVVFEIAAIRSARPEEETDTDSLLARIDALETRVNSMAAGAQPANIFAAEPDAARQSVKPKPEKPAPAAVFAPAQAKPAPAAAEPSAVSDVPWDEEESPTPTDVPWDEEEPETEAVVESQTAEREPEPEPEEIPAHAEPAAAGGSLLSSWNAIMSGLPMHAGFFEQSAREEDGDSIIVSFFDSFSKEMAEGFGAKADIEEAYAQRFGRPISVIFRNGEKQTAQSDLENTVKSIFRGIEIEQE